MLVGDKVTMSMDISAVNRPDSAARGDAPAHADALHEQTASLRRDHEGRVAHPQRLEQAFGQQRREGTAGSASENDAEQVVGRVIETALMPFDANAHRAIPEGPLESVSIRQLSKHASVFIREVELGGKPVIVTRMGTPIGYLVPLDYAREHLPQLSAASDPPGET
jgi:prevent-host-death family protein